MTEILQGENIDEENVDFGEMLNAYESSKSASVQIGEKIRCKIISIEKDMVFIDTGTKIDGFIEKKELLDEKGDLPYKIGDEVELYIVFSNESEIRLSRAIAGKGDFDLLKDAYDNKIPVEGKIIGLIKGGLHVEIMQKRAFCPASQLDTKYIENQESFVGQTCRFLITKLEDKGRNIIVSRRIILEQELIEKQSKILETLSEGDIIEGKVVRLMPYGAFVELFPGIEGMMHISELSWSRSDNINDFLKENDLVKVKIVGIKKGDKPGQVKISLSAKQLNDDPWDSINEKIKIGDIIEGKVSRLAKFGAFVEIFPGIEGLVHISEMSNTKRVISPESIVKPGDKASVMIKEISTAQKRISLSIKSAQRDIDAVRDNDNKKSRENELNEWKKYSTDNSKSLGTFADKLAAALKAKK